MAEAERDLNKIEVERLRYDLDLYGRLEVLLEKQREGVWAKLVSIERSLLELGFDVAAE